MEREIAQITTTLFQTMLAFAMPAAVARLIVAGLKHLLGDKEAAELALKQVAAGLCIIFLARTIVWVLETMFKAAAVMKMW